MTTAHTDQIRRVQLNANGELCHLLDLEGLERSHLIQIMDQADSFFQRQTDARERTSIRKLPLLRGRTVVNLFFENSTRTRVTFQMGADKLSADFIDWELSTSSVSKGETLLDTIRNIEAMHGNILVIRHPWSGSAQFVATHCRPETTILNAGDGCHAHPTQALLDLYTIRQHCQNFSDLSVAIIGDIRHSRVARSLCHGLGIMGCSDIRLISPPLLGSQLFERSVGARSFTDIKAGIDGCNVVVVLRLQLERMRENFTFELDEYARDYGVSEEHLARLSPKTIVMHPGPINRGVEIAADVADGPRSVILDQVHNGIAIRMAVMTVTINNQREPRCRP